MPTSTLGACSPSTAPRRHRQGVLRLVREARPHAGPCSPSWTTSTGPRRRSSTSWSTSPTRGRADRTRLPRTRGAPRGATRRAPERLEDRAGRPDARGLGDARRPPRRRGGVARRVPRTRVRGGGGQPALPRAARRLRGGRRVGRRRTGLYPPPCRRSSPPGSTGSAPASGPCSSAARWWARSSPPNQVTDYSTRRRRRLRVVSRRSRARVRPEERRRDASVSATSSSRRRRTAPPQVAPQRPPRRLADALDRENGAADAVIGYHLERAYRPADRAGAAGAPRSGSRRTQVASSAPPGFRRMAPLRRARRPQPAGTRDRAAPGARPEAGWSSCANSASSSSGRTTDGRMRGGPRGGGRAVRRRGARVARSRVQLAWIHSRAAEIDTSEMLELTSAAIPFFGRPATTVRMGWRGRSSRRSTGRSAGAGPYAQTRRSMR